MPFNLLKKYNELLELTGMTEAQRSASLKRIFDRDITNNICFLFRGKPIYPTPKENGEIAMANLFNHLTRKMENQENRHFDMLSSLILCNNNEPFLDQIVTCNEK